MNATTFGMLIAAGVMAHGAYKMGNKPWWDIVSGFVEIMIGVGGFVACLCLKFVDV